MNKSKIEKLLVIENENGKILRGLKKSEQDFRDFGELYFSKIHHGKVKGWKKHTKMHSNLLVPVGTVRFVLYNEKNFEEFTIGSDNHHRLNVPPGIWMAFQGIGPSENLVVNLADIEHDSTEAESLPLEEIPFTWDSY